MTKAHNINTGRAEFERLQHEIGWQELAEWFIDQSTVPGASEAFKEAGAALATVMDKHFGARG
jgi:hypothetical protein